MHITDWFPTLLRAAGAAPPADRVLDGVDQRDRLTGRAPGSAREGYLFWMGAELYGVKWRNFKLALVAQRYSTDPPSRLSSPRIINLVTDPQEREPINAQYLHSWTAAHFNRLLGAYHASVTREPLIPAGAPWTSSPPTPAREPTPRRRRAPRRQPASAVALISSSWPGKARAVTPTAVQAGKSRVRYSAFTSATACRSARSTW
jgi:hypothetical protein